MHTFSRVGIHGYGVVLVVLMGWHILCEWFFVSCGNCSDLYPDRIDNIHIFNCWHT
jgi:hypothetical protein